ncbi:MAG: sigma-54 dependent transcriptional regulator [Kiritimatiellae bacterium]|jgi:two-component system response regulator AtoC|nr:sigma-54 dependent transcriptional regulator [Kiritimatiellia bacterium]
MKKNNILIVDDDSVFRDDLSEQLEKMYRVSNADSTKTFQQIFEPYAFALVVLDMRLEKERDGLEILSEIMEIDPFQLVIIVTKYVDTETHISAIESGAQLYLNKDEFSLPFIAQMIDVILHQGHLRRKVATLEKRLDTVDSINMVGQSPELRMIQEKVRQAATDGEVTVLIHGESGTGKELVAQNIHRLSPLRREEPFVAVSVAGLHKETMHSALFGHEKGSFTGATSRRKGYIEEANGGTLFLDEIGDLNMEAQVKLLRVLETRTFQRLGGNREISADFQLVTATNQNLKELIEQKAFRQDLYYRLQAFEIKVSPLRERKKDIVMLAEYFLKKMVEDGRTSATVIHRKVFEILSQYSWPGNIRELKNVIEFSAIRAKTSNENAITLEHLPTTLMRVENSNYIPAINGDIDMDYKTWLARSELVLCDRIVKESGLKQKTELARVLKYNDRYIFSRRIKRALEDCKMNISEFEHLEKIF